MKIITEENGIKKLYMQRIDFACLPCLIEDGAPAIAYWIGLEFLHTNNEENKQEFILVENEQLAHFIEGTEYILNYYDFMNYSIEELKEKVRILTSLSSAISNAQSLNQNKYMRMTLLNFIDSKKQKNM
ncbi:MAG: hypothetical protein HFH08_02940 [Bacilli bacterium]|nr:hypothetical protein [Bacilli bacterium]